jgi:hypothetical protein
MKLFPAADQQAFVGAAFAGFLAPTVDEPAAGFHHARKLRNLAVVIVPHDVAGHHDVKRIVRVGEVICHTVRDADVPNARAPDLFPEIFAQGIDRLACVNLLRALRGGESEAAGAAAHVQHGFSSKVGKLEQTLFVPCVDEIATRVHPLGLCVEYEILHTGQHADFRFTNRGGGVSLRRERRDFPYEVRAFRAFVRDIPRDGGVPRERDAHRPLPFRIAAAAFQHPAELKALHHQYAVERKILNVDPA